MQTDADIFSSPKSPDPKATQALTERLYPDRGIDPYKPDQSQEKPSAFEELKRLLAQSSPAAGRAAKEFGLENEAGAALEGCVKAFQLAQAEKARQYMERAAHSKKEDYCLYYLHGWPAQEGVDAATYLTEQSRKATGGVFLRWNGKGIAINPGKHFLHAFHAKGLHIRDIDYVIVTGDQPECFVDVAEIYELNYQINKLGAELKVIQYFFHQKAFQELSGLLKPHFKQERNMLHSLELFLDSPEVERTDIAEGIVLNYFLTSSREERAMHSPLGIRMDLKAENGMLRIGYLSQSAWSPLLAHHLGSCDLLLTGFGNTNPQDYHKLSYHADSLGYHGTFSLLEEIAPRLALCGEFAGREGDIRFEVVQKIRLELAHSRNLAILPADTGLSINLQTLEVRCSVSGEWTPANQIKVIKTSQTFGPLLYLAPAYVY
ncbi:MAG: hypothetical protein LLG04_02420 [Parachlamydia sp.]|nr:hypothetical protein [Parachlamydia sp.]